MNSIISVVALLEHINGELEKGVEFISLDEIFTLIEKEGF